MSNVLLIKGLSQYNAMRNYIDEIEVGFRLAGFNTITLDYKESSGALQLIEIKRTMQIDFVFTCNVILIDKLKIFDNAIYLTYLCDHPAEHHGRMQKLDERAVVFTCDRNFEKYIKTHYKNIKYVKYIPLSGSYSQKYIPFENRKYDVVFTGSYARPEQSYAEALSGKTGELKKITKYMLQDIIAHTENTFDTCLMRALESMHMKLSEASVKALVPQCSGVNDYARWFYRDKIIRTLLENEIPVHVFGNGWEEFESDCKQNLIIEEGNYYIAQKAVANSKISLNIMPWFKDGFQERIATAMLSGTVAVTDESIYINDNFETGRELVTFSLDKLEELPGKIRNLLDKEELAERIADTGRERAMGELTWQHRTFEMIDYIMQTTDWIKDISGGAYGEVLQIPYSEDTLHDRSFGLDIMDNLVEIMKILEQLNEYDQIDLCDVKYLYERYLFLFLRARANFPQIRINAFTYNYLMNLKEEELENGIELFTMECRSFQDLFLQVEYHTIRKEKQILETSASGRSEEYKSKGKRECL